LSGVPRLWIVDPAVVRAEDEGVAEVLHGWPGTSRLFRPALEPASGPRPDTGYDADAVVLLGSRASVHDDHAWLRDLAAWLRPIVAGEVRIPVLGICFGHQLLGHLAGARVGPLRADGSKLAAVVTSRCEGGRLVPGPRELRVVASHRERISEPRPGWRVTARRPEVEYDGIEHERLPLFGFQFHPEARTAFAASAGIAPTEIDERLRRDSAELLSAFRALVLRG
jgi:GMP synthase-like glutamine amidotransferase